MTRIVSWYLFKMISSPFAFCFTTSQFSGARPACPSLIFCFLAGFLPFLMFGLLYAFLFVVGVVCLFCLIF